jgi:hypothetical protein
MSMETASVETPPPTEDLVKTAIKGLRNEFGTDIHFAKDSGNVIDIYPSCVGYLRFCLACRQNSGAGGLASPARHLLPCRLCPPSRNPINSQCEIDLESSKCVCHGLVRAEQNLKQVMEENGAPTTEPYLCQSVLTSRAYPGPHASDPMYLVRCHNP